MMIHRKRLRILKFYTEDIWGDSISSRKPSKINTYLYGFYKYREQHLHNFYEHNYLRFSQELDNFKFLKNRRSRSKVLIMRRKLKFFYGNLSENTLRSYYTKSSKVFSGCSVKNFSLRFLNFLETRAEVVLYRSGLTKTIWQARKLILHQKVYVNSRLVNQPGMPLKTFDVLKVNAGVICGINFLKKIPNYLTVNYKLNAVMLNSYVNQLIYPFNLNLENLSDVFFV